jgi:hypothetical protein
MKKVHYAWGAVGAVPAIGVMAIPAIAAAPQAPAATARATTPAAKTVSLRHTSAPARLTAAFASTSASYASTSVNTAGGCTGNTVATKSNVSTKLKFWHTFHPAYDTSCIGTVVVSYFNKIGSYSSYNRVRIYAHHLDGAKYKAYSHHSKARSTGQHLFTDGVHRSFGYPPIQVCVAAVSYYGNRDVDGPVCKSVG